MDRRAFLKTMAAGGASVALLGSRSWVPRAQAETTRSFAARSAPCRFGAFVDPFGGDTIDAITDFETLIGRPLAITRHYLPWKIPLPGKTILRSAAGGHIPYVSWHATTRTNVAIPWTSITSGTWDEWIVSRAESIRDAGFPMYLAFHHEPEDDTANGTAADFAAAHDHIRHIFNEEGVTNVRWVVTLMASTYRGGHKGYASWLPQGFNLLGVDGYNRHPCISSPQKHPWKSFEEIFTPAHDAAVSTGKRLFVGENGSVEQCDCGSLGDPEAKARWFADQCSTLRSWPEVKAVLYSHTTCHHNGYLMKYRVDSSAESLAAYTAFGQDPNFLAAAA